MSQRSEIFVGLVAPVGVRLDVIVEALSKYCSEFGYVTHNIRLSSLLRNSSHWKEPRANNEASRIENAQDVAKLMRQEQGDAAVVARAAIHAVQVHRGTATSSKQLYILNQLKHPSEVDLLRQVYGDAFVVVGANAPKTVRTEALAERNAESESRQVGPLDRATAIRLIERDEDEGDDLGQNTRLTYPKADFFANFGKQTGAFEINRFVELLFGHPFHSPTPHEFAMHQASSMALRSSDRSRQVGAVIVRFGAKRPGRSADVEVIASGMNEVPRAGGGYYWTEDSPDGRDQALGDQSRSDRIKVSALAELIERMQDANVVSDTSPAANIAKTLLPKIKRTQFIDIGEFVRPVHAEMAAIIDSSRRGVAVQSATMYVTTFPCHNCAKHIIAAGLKRVVYLEPYPKSRANYLHGEELVLEPSDFNLELEDKVVFAPFNGVAPRQYRTVFSMLKRGKTDLRAWDSMRKELLPLYQLNHASLQYVAAESEAISLLPTSYRRSQ